MFTETTTAAVRPKPAQTARFADRSSCSSGGFLVNALLLRSGIAAGVLALAACGGGNGEGLDANGQPLPNGQQGPSGGGSAVMLAPTLASIQANVFSVNCTNSGCHGGGTVQQGLRLETGFSAASLINIVSPQDGTLTRVIPGNPDGSFLIQKLEGTHTVGSRMPAGGAPALEQTTIDVIRQWIQVGTPP